MTGLGAAKLTIHNPTPDYGELPSGWRYTKLVRLENTGDEVLIIESIKTSWGGSVMSYPKDPIAPGEQVLCNLTLQISEGMRGPQRKAATITSNDPENRHQQIRYQFIIPEMPVKQPRLTMEREVHNFGTVEHRGNTTYEFEVRNTGSAPLILSQVKTSCGCLVASWPKEPIAPGKTAAIRARYDSKRLGPINKSITVVSNDPEKPTTVLRIRGKVIRPEELHQTSAKPLPVAAPNR